MLQHGATQVYAVDVGYGQLDWKLRQDPRVVVMEKTHILKLDPASLAPPPSMASVDVSFISLKKVLPHVTRCLQAGPSDAKTIVALVKPQFEYKDYCAPKGFQGVVTDNDDLVTILTALIGDLVALLAGWTICNLAESPIRGPKGNREFLLHLAAATNPEPALPEELTAQIQRLVFTAM
jgi:23S rRNA (cytidine1920-2'-O)/16S rRNA (cytidine1409-2'-O)-methyltransferase